MEALAHDPVAVAILLAAVAAGDGGARQAALDPALRARVDAVARTVAAMPRDAAVTALAAAVVPPLGDGIASAPARVRAIVAKSAGRERGGAWLAEAGPPRVGFRPSAALRATILATEEGAWRA